MAKTFCFSIVVLSDLLKEFADSAIVTYIVMSLYNKIYFQSNILIAIQPSSSGAIQNRGGAHFIIWPKITSWLVKFSDSSAGLDLATQELP